MRLLIMNDTRGVKMTSRTKPPHNDIGGGYTMQQTIYFMTYIYF